MIITTIDGNLEDLTDEEIASTHVEKVILPLEALRKKVQRVVTDHGREFGLRLDGPGDLRYGDILLRDDHGLVVVAVESSEVLVIAPESIGEMGVVAHTLGNRHLPAQFLGADEEIEGLDRHDGVMVIQYDHTAEHYLDHAGVRYLRTTMTMPVPFHHAEHTH